MGYRNVDIGDDVIDSRDLAEMLDKLLDELADYEEEVTAAKNDEEKAKAEERLKDFEDEYDNIISDLQDAANEVGEWKNGNALILDSHFVEHAQELCEDLGYISKNFPWWIEIDWERTAENVKMDYSEIEIDGHTYYYRDC